MAATSTYDDDDDDDGKRSWSNLIVELLEMIMRRLTFIDRLSFCAVCRSWRSMSQVSMPNQMPWLMIFDDTDTKSWSSCKLVDPATEKMYTINLKSLKKKNKIQCISTMTVHESKYGWLLISSQSQRKNLFLYTPFSNHNNVINLPALNFESFGYATFTSDPLKKDCLFLILKPSYSKNTLGIKTCRLGDKSWSCTRKFKCGFSLEDVACWLYSEGIIYYILTDGLTLGTFDITRQEWGVLPKPTPCTDPYHPKSKYHKIHMVKTNAELYIVLGNWQFMSNFCEIYGHFMRLDLSQMTWLELAVPYVRRKEEVVLSWFLGTGYGSVMNLSDQEEGMCYSMLPNVYYCKDYSVDPFPRGYHNEPSDLLHRRCLFNWINGKNDPEPRRLKSYLSRLSCARYGSYACERYRTLWIDPIVVTNSVIKDPRRKRRS